MYLPKPNEGTEFTPPPSGTHAAVCFRVIDLGRQDTTFGVKHQILLSWELPEELMTDGRPFMVSKRYTWSTSEKANLRKDLESWRGRAFKESDFGEGGFDIKNVLGVGCLLNIVHDENEKTGKTYANVSGVSKLPKNMTTGKPTNKIVYLALTPDGFDVAALNELSEGLKNTIKSSPEYAELMGSYKKQIDQEAPEEYNELNPPPIDSEIPF
jgi:hypothetical protein